MITSKETLKRFQEIPGVGKSIAQDLIDLGFSSIDELKGKNPAALYDNFCNMVGTKVDRCLLYVFRLAVYYAENENREPELLKWWNWKDKKYNE